MENLIFDKHIAFGLTPFETIYFQDNNAQYVREHYRRLVRACRLLGIKLGKFEKLAVFEQFVDNAVAEISEIHGTDHGVVKVIASCDGWMTQGRLPGYGRIMYEAGLRLSVSKAVRDKHNVFSYFKTFNYGMSYVEDQRAKRRGFDTSLHLNQYAEICETAFANIFFVKDKTIYTPPVSSGILNGVMRTRLQKLIPEFGYQVEHRKLSLQDISSFSECFITNSVAGVFPVCMIDEFKFRERVFAERVNCYTEFTRPWSYPED